MFYKKYSHRILKYLFVIICFTFLLMRNILTPDIWENNGYVCFAITFGGVLPDSFTDLISLLITLVPIIAIIHIFSDYMRSDFIINYVYVFTRLGKKSKWLFQKSRQLFFEISLIYLIMFFITFVFSIGLGYKFSSINLEMFILLISLYLLNVFTMFLIIFFLNILSLKIGSVRAFMITIFAYILQLILSMLFYNNKFFTTYICALFPVSQQMYFWHNNIPIPTQLENFIQNPINEFYLIKSFVLLLFYIGITYTLSYVLINKQDLTSIVVEDSK